MKQKIIISFLIILLTLFALTESYAITSSGGYYIEAYDINMIVNENNTFDITETISVNFTGYNKHGIFRKIPTINTVTRQDGIETKNKAKITNVSISDTYTTLNENHYKIFKIGDKDKTVYGPKTYVIKYNYDIGKDPLKDIDELYFNLIGDEWDSKIEKVTFTITMPKSFDESKLGFSSGDRYSTDSSNINYTVNGNVINGSIETGLSIGQALTVRLSLPEGYFNGAGSIFDNVMSELVVSIFCVIIAFILWLKYGKDELPVDTVEFYPPNGINSAELGFIYKGYSEQKDIISLLIYLANKGYLKIEENKKSKSNRFKIIKLKDYDGDNENEKIFFDGLFEKKNEITKTDLYDNFYLIIEKIRRNINKKENKEKIFEKKSFKKKKTLVCLIIIVFLMMGGATIFSSGNDNLMTISLFLLGIPLLIFFIRSNKWTTMIVSLAFVTVSFLGMYQDFVIDPMYIIKFIIGNICLVFLIVFLDIMKKRTKYGIEMLGKIQGFKYFLVTAEKPKLEELVMNEPEYFYNILPYTYVLGVSNKWIKNFEDIALQAPKWYYTDTDFNNYEFNMFMTSTFSSISTAMTYVANDGSGSSGGFSGGGFSGGGSGGGGGGSW